MIDTYDDIQICICELWSESWLMRGTQCWRRIRTREQLENEDRPSKLYNSRWLPGRCVLWVESVLHLENVNVSVDPRREMSPLSNRTAIIAACRPLGFVTYMIALHLGQLVNPWRQLEYCMYLGTQVQVATTFHILTGVTAFQKCHSN